MLEALTGDLLLVGPDLAALGRDCRSPELDRLLEDLRRYFVVLVLDLPLDRALVSSLVSVLDLLGERDEDIDDLLVVLDGIFHLK